MAISYYFERTAKEFKTQTSLKKFFKEMLERYKQSNETIQGNDKLILIDFLENFHPECNYFSDKYDLENANFYVDKVRQYPTYCFHIESQGKREQFSTNRFKAPTQEENLSNCLRYMIQDIKIEIKKRLKPNDWEHYNLVHKYPKFKEIVEKFIEQENIKNELEYVVSDNNSRNNVPILMPKYEYLKDKFIDLYKKTYTDIHEQYELKKLVDLYF